MGTLSGCDARESADMSESPLQPADIPVRIVARLIDAVVLAGLQTGLGLLIGFGAAWLLLAATSVLAYFALFDAQAGATPGKRLMGLRVVGPHGGLPTLNQALRREIFTIVGAVPFIGGLLALVAWIWILVSIRSNPWRQGKHDLLAGGTRVIRDWAPSQVRQSGRPASGA